MTITQDYAFRHFPHYLILDHGGIASNRFIDGEILSRGWDPFLAERLTPLFKLGCRRVVFPNFAGFAAPGSFELDAWMKTQDAGLFKLSDFAAAVHRNVPRGVEKIGYVGHSLHPSFDLPVEQAYQRFLDCCRPLLYIFDRIIFDGSAGGYQPDGAGEWDKNPGGCWRYCAVKAVQFAGKRIGVEAGSWVVNRRWWLGCDEFDVWPINPPRWNPADRGADRARSGESFVNVEANWDESRADYLAKLSEPIPFGYTPVARLDRFIGGKP